MIDTPRGKYIAIRVGDPPQDEGEHFVRCPACGGWIDCRNLACVSPTEGREKHPAKNAQKDKDARWTKRDDESFYGYKTMSGRTRRTS
jgi:hypothetical protein